MLPGYRDFDACAEGVERRKYLAPHHSRENLHKISCPYKHFAQNPKNSYKSLIQCAVGERIVLTYSKEGC